MHSLQLRCAGFVFLVLFSLQFHSAAQVPGDEHWDVRFGYPGVDGSLQLAVATKGEDVYIGGDFTLAGAKNFNHIAKWDGTAWSGLGSGIMGGTNFTFVYALAWKGAELYAGGIFTNAGGVLARGIAKWDGTNWSALPGNFNGYVLDMAVDGSDLYVAGIFGIGDDTNTYVFAKFDGANWSTYGSTVSGCVGSFCVAAAGCVLIDGPEFYVGGSFNTFAGVTANSIVKWNGNSWVPLTTGVSGTNVSVQGLAKLGNDLIVAGGFTSAGGVSAFNIARWNGSAWSAFGNPNNTVEKLLADGGQLYVGGSFTQIGGVAANRIARWDGANWSALGTGLSSTVNNIALAGSGALYVVGPFLVAGNASAAQVACWSGGTWSGVGTNLGNGMNRAIGFVRAFDVVGNDLYAGGSFSTAGGILASRVARWNGTSWSALGTGIVGPVTSFVRAIAHVGNDVYFGGTFTNAGGTTISNIARWNSSSWSGLSSGLNSNVNALAVSGTELYVGGAFTMAGSLPANRVAKWTGSGWLTLSSGMNSNVNALAVGSNGDVYAGGLFTMAGGVPANKVAKWNNATGWAPLGNGINFGNVLALAVSGSNVYVGGLFSFADSISVNHVAKWDGVSWSALGTGIQQATSSTTPVNAIAVHGNDVYVGGTIANAGGVEVRAIARWDGTNWQALGTGLTTTPGSPAVNALLATPDSLYVGGNFVRAGVRPAANMARWVFDPFNIHLSGQAVSSGQFHFHVSGLLGLKYRVESSGDFRTWNALLRDCSFADGIDFSTDAALTGAQFFRAVAEP